MFHEIGRREVGEVAWTPDRQNERKNESQTDTSLKLAARMPIELGRSRFASCVTEGVLSHHDS